MSDHGCPNCGGRNVNLIQQHDGPTAPNFGGFYHVDEGRFVFQPDCADCSWTGTVLEIQATPVEGESE